MSARQRRLIADYTQIMADFKEHKNIKVEPIGTYPPERYHVIYLVNGIFMNDDHIVQNSKRHEIDIILHSEYPRYKPVVKISTPIYHPNFKEGQVCIGDIWGAGETLSDIIVNIGEMIQYQSWNSYSPLSAEAAEWAIKNKYMFPVGDICLNPGIDSNLEENTSSSETNTPEQCTSIENDSTPGYFEITSEELIGVTFIPTAERLQGRINETTLVDTQSLNFMTILKKGIVWGLLGGIIGWGINELTDDFLSTENILKMLGYTYSDLDRMDYDSAINLIQNSLRFSTALFTSIIASSIGAIMGFGEGKYYGSSENARKYALKGAGISLGFGLVIGYVAQIVYSNLLAQSDTDLFASLARGLAWSLLGLSAGLGIGLVKPEKRRVIFTSVGGLFGGFFGGFLFNYVYEFFATSETDTGTFARFVGIIILGSLIGLGVGMLEQFAKSAWLKVVKGDFEGKEYLVFSGTTKIGNNQSNTIVLFKDKNVSANHCDIVRDGGKYVLIDLGSSSGTAVNGNRINKHILKKGDVIGIGNTLLVFNLKEGN